MPIHSTLLDDFGLNPSQSNWRPAVQGEFLHTVSVPWRYHLRLASGTSHTTSSNSFHSTRSHRANHLNPSPPTTTLFLRTFERCKSSSKIKFLASILVQSERSYSGKHHRLHPPSNIEKTTAIMCLLFALKTSSKLHEI